MKKRLTYVPKGIIKAIPIMMLERKNTSLTDNILKIKTRQFDI